MDALNQLINQSVTPLRRIFSLLESRVRSLENRFNPNSIPFAEGTTVTVGNKVYQVKIGRWIVYTKGMDANNEVSESMKYDLNAANYLRLAMEEKAKARKVKRKLKVPG